MATYTLDLAINNVILGALRKVNGFTDGDIPDGDQSLDATRTLMKLFAKLENDGVRFFQKISRSYTFSDPDTVYEDSQGWRCYNSYTVPDISAWSNGDNILIGDAVYPSTYNGFYYVATTNGTTGTSEPTFPTNQNDTVVDGGVTWMAYPDTKPGSGKAFRLYWVEDDSVDDTASSFAVDTSYRSSGDFQLRDDEAFIIDAYIQYQNFSRFPLEIIGPEEYNQISQKWQKGEPDCLFIESRGKNDQWCHVYSIPNVTGENGYVLRYNVALKTDKSEDGDNSFPLTDTWLLALEWMLASEISCEYSLDIQDKIYIDRKAEAAYKQARRADKPLKRNRRIRSCYS